MMNNTYIKKHLPVSRLGFGAWPLGNTRHGSAMSLEEGVALVKSAFAAGINFFDTAPNYAGGRSEEILGEALKDVRADVVINSKFGHKEDDTFDFGEDAIEPSIRRSLKRLKTTYLDSVLLHNPDISILQGKTGHFNVLKRLKQQGLIRAYGVSIDTEEELRAALAIDGIEVIELLYNIHFQGPRNLLDTIKKKAIALIVKVPLDSGWLTGVYHSGVTFDGIKKRWSDADKVKRTHLIDQLKGIVGQENLIPYALGFLWSYDAVTTVIPGIRTEAQLREHLDAEQKPFDRRYKKSFEAFYDQHIQPNPLPW